MKILGFPDFSSMKALTEFLAEMKCLQPRFNKYFKTKCILRKEKSCFLRFCFWWKRLKREISLERARYFSTGIYLCFLFAQVCTESTFCDFLTPAISLVNSQSLAHFLCFTIVISHKYFRTNKYNNYSNFLFSHTSAVGYMNYAYDATVSLHSNCTFKIETSFALRNCVKVSFMQWTRIGRFCCTYFV